MNIIKDCLLFLISGCVIGGLLGYGLSWYFEDPDIYEIRTCQDLRDVHKDLDGDYILMNDIDWSDC